MTQEEKAKAYDRALEIAKAWYKLDNNDLSNDDLETLFPELKESDDFERIRKALIDGFTVMKESKNCGKTFSNHNIPVVDILAWLEKQGEQKVSYTTIVETGNGGINALVTRELPTNGCDEQKSIDKVEPKFKVGDWVVFNGLTLYVKEVVKGFYRTISKGGIPNSYGWDIDNVARLWTIQDAKDGDVLYENETKTILLFKSIESGWCMIHCEFWLKKLNFTQSNKQYGRVREMSIYPATKEQCDLLFQKMKEAGYEWDFEKKELKKIEQKSAWSEEDDDDAWMNDIISKVENNLQLNKAEIEWLKSLKDRVQPKQEWSEENKNMINKILAVIKLYYDRDGDDLDKQSCISWLKSLRPQNRWKPSDEQMADLWNMLCECRPADHQLLQDIYYGLKKLREDKAWAK